MSKVRLALYFSAAGAGLCLTWGYLSAGWMIPAGIALGSSGFWIAAAGRGWRPAAPAALLLYAGLSAAGIFVGAPAGWMTAGMVFGLGVWDLMNFFFQLESAARVSGRKGVINRHLVLLGAVGAGCAGAFLLARTLNTPIRFFWVVVLSGGLILILNGLVNQLGDR